MGKDKQAITPPELRVVGDSIKVLDQPSRLPRSQLPELSQPHS